MTKFNKAGARARVGSTPINSLAPAVTNHQGGTSYVRDPKSELFILGISNLVGEKTFHENGMVRDERFAGLIHVVAREDSAWLAGFLPWLRKEANLRSAPLVGALEAAKAMVDAKIPGSRQIIAQAGNRPDEPGEMLAYWLTHYGRRIPKPVKRGIADLATRVYNEYGLLKYDTASKPFRFADVIELTHPKVGLGWKSDLMRHALDRRHGHDQEIPESLAMIRARRSVKNTSIEDIEAQDIKATGMNWQNTISAAVDKKAAWEKQIPSMGYEALLKNLRNFDEAGVDSAVLDEVAKRIADPEQVRRSRQFPFRFLSAFNAVNSVRWSWPLEQALNLSLHNVSELRGETLIMVDCSTSMNGRVSEYSDMITREIAALFGSALHIRNQDNSKLVAYGGSSATVVIPRGASVLTGIKQFRDMGNTFTANAMMTHLEKKHNRVIIITDEQHHAGQNPSSVLSSHIPLYVFNLVGYRYATTPNTANRVTIGGGLSDASFRIVSLLEAGRNGVWPWEEESVSVRSSQ